MTDGKQTLKGYELREELGQGGFGAVYRAYQPAVEREVAIKVILQRYANEPEFVRRFEVEAQVVARLEHPHIVPLFDYWRDPDGAYLVMRLLRGGSLTRRLHQGRLSPDEALRMVEQLTSALHVAHRAGVIHRDLKPDNILLDTDGNAYLSDFGIAKVVTPTEPTTALNEEEEEGVSGTLSYMAPEQLTGEALSQRSDLYSFGIIVYQMFTGEHPFGDATPSEMVFRHIEGDIPLIDLPDVPRGVNDVIQKATAKRPEARYDDALALYADLRRVMTGTISTPEVDWRTLENPYKGLRAFQEVDASDFFGREALVEHLLAQVGEDTTYGRFLAVVGPSGSGKSSVVKAGLIPALRRGGLPGSERWFVAEMVPGATPLRELETALLSVAVLPPFGLYNELKTNPGALRWALEKMLPRADDHLLLVIDQFEELFTLVAEEAERTQFLTLLRTAALDPSRRIHVLVTLRADFMDRPLQYVDFGELMRQRTEFVLPLTPDELERAITGPAHRVGAEVDGNLIAAIIADVAEEPGALPLLQYALTEIFERREGPVLTLGAYQALGGVIGALARRAEEVYSGLTTGSAALQPVVKQVFLRLVTLGEGTEDTRRRVRRRELASVVKDAQALTTVLDTFGKYRLFSFDRDPETREPTVEVAHEALIRQWELLRTWLDASRADVRLQRLLAAAAHEWDKAGRDPGYLLSGSRLAQFEEWAGDTDVALAQEERAYLEASIAERVRQMALEQERQARERATERAAARNLRVLVIVMVLALLLTAGLLFLAYGQWQQAQASERAQGTQAKIALVAAATATVAQGAAVIQAQLAQDSAATATFALGQAQANATQAAQAGATAIVALGTAQARGTQVADSARAAQDSAATAVRAQDDALAQADTAVAAQADALAQAATATNALGQAQAAGTAVADSAQAALDSAATATNALGQAQVRGTEAAVSGATAIVALGQAQAAGTAVSDSAQAALDSAATATNALGQAQVRGTEAADNAATAVANAARADDNAGTAVAALVISETSERQARAQALAVFADQALNFGDSDTALALALESARLNPGLVLAQSVLNRVINVSPIFAANNSPLARFSPDGARIATLSADGRTVYLWDIATRTLLATLSGHLDRVNDVAFSLDGALLISASQDTSIVVWDTATGTERFRLTGHRGAVDRLAVSPNGTQFVSAGRDPLLILWDLRAGTEVRRFTQTDTPIEVMRFNSDGRVLFTWTIDQPPNGRTVLQWGMESGQLRFTQGDAPFAGMSRDGRYRVALQNGQLALRNAFDDSLFRRMPQDVVRVFDFSPDGRYLLVGISGGRFNPDQTVALLDFANGEVITVWGSGGAASINRNTGRVGASDLGFFIPTNVTNALFAPDSDIVLATLSDNQVVLFSVTNRVPVRYVGRSDRILETLDYNVGGTFALTVSPDGAVRVWETALTEAALVRRMDNPMPAVAPVVRELLVNPVAPDGSTYVLVDPNQFVMRAFRTADGTQIGRNMDTHTANVSAMAYAPDGLTFVSGDVAGTIIQWDITSGREVRRWSGHVNAVRLIVFSADGTRALTASDDGTLRLWDLTQRGSPLQAAQRFSTSRTGGTATSAAFSADGTQIISYHPQAVIVWDILSAQEWVRYPAGVLSSDRTLLAQVAVSDDGGGMYSAVVTMLNAGDGTALYTLVVNGIAYDPVNSVQHLAVSDNYLLFALGDSSLVLYDARTGALLRRFIGHTAAPTAVAFSADGQTAVSAARDGSMILWDVTSGQVIRRYIFGGGLTVWRIVYPAPGGRFVQTVMPVSEFNVGRNLDVVIGYTAIIWRLDTLDEVVAFARSRRAVPDLTCAQRAQYNVRPLCVDGSVPTATLAPGLTPTATVPPSATPLPTPTPTPFLSGTVTSSQDAIVRAEPRPDAAVLGSLPPGTTVYILQDAGDWFQVALPDGTIGWVSALVMTRN